MSVMQYKQDLLKPGAYEESRESSNVGMHAALILTLALSLLMVMIAAFAPHQMASQFRGHSRSLQTADNSSYVGGTAVQGDARVNASK